MAPPPGSQRDVAANEAIRDTVNHLVHQYIKQEVARELGVDAQGVPLAHSAAAAHDDAGYRGTTDRRAQMELHATSPLHSWKVGILLILSMFGLMPLVTAFSTTVLFGGATVVYISDHLGYRKGSIVALFLSLLTFGTSVGLTNLHALTSLGPFALFVNAFLGLLSVTAAVALLQYRWIQTDYPFVVVFLERMVCAMGPLASLPSIFATAVALVGSRHAGMLFAVCMCVLHYVFFTPLESSFLKIRHSRGFQPRRRREEAGSGADPHRHEHDEDDRGDEEDNDELHPCRLNGREEATLFTALTLLLPAVTYVTLQSNWGVASQLHAMNLISLVGIPVMYLFLDPTNTLWFLRPQSAKEEEEFDLVHDPIGLWASIIHLRFTVLGFGYFVLMHWCVYRLLHSRYQYLFVGVPPPFNGILLLLAGYCATIMIVLARRVLLHEQKTGTKKSLFGMERVAIMLLSVIFALLVAGAAGMPGVFFPMSALAAASFNAYLLDRRNANNYSMFVCCSMLLLLWWMYRTFSFIAMDLHVLGESMTVSTVAVAASCLWAYLLAAAVFGLSFHENKRLMEVALFFHALKVAWIEHVLYSQREAGSYPGILVLGTSLAGAWLCQRMWNNQIVSTGAASCVAAVYVAKLFTFLCETAAVQYLDDSAAERSKSADARRLLESTIGWWAAFFVVFWFFVLEYNQILLKRGVAGPSLPVKLLEDPHNLMTQLSVAALFVSLCTMTNAQRAAIEFLTRQYTTPDSALHATIGTSMMVFSGIILFILSRHRVTFLTMQPYNDFCKFLFLAGASVAVIRPTHFVADNADSSSDFELLHPNAGRILGLLGVCLALLSRFAPIFKLHIVLRGLFWLVTASLLSVGLAITLVPLVTLHIVLACGAFMFFLMLTLDICHYRNLTVTESWIIYGCSVGSLVFVFIALGRVDLMARGRSNLMIVWEFHETSRLTLLAVGCSAFLFTSVVLKFRLMGRSLLPNALPLTQDMLPQIGLIANYSTLLGVVIMSILNVWAGDASPLIFILTGFLLLLLVDDNTLFLELGHDSNRYIPVLLYIMAALWGTHVYDAFQIFQEKHSWWAGAKLILFALPVAFSHISIARVLYVGRRRGGVHVVLVLAMVCIDLAWMVFSGSHVVQWLALVGAMGQLCRLYEARFWKRGTLDMIL